MDVAHVLRGLLVQFHVTKVPSKQWDLNTNTGAPSVSQLSVPASESSGEPSSGQVTTRATVAGAALGLGLRPGQGGGVPAAGIGDPATTKGVRHHDVPTAEAVPWFTVTP